MNKVLANTMLVIILQYTNVSNQHVVYINLIQLICQLYYNKEQANKNLKQSRWPSPEDWLN